MEDGVHSNLVVSPNYHTFSRANQSSFVFNQLRLLFGPVGIFRNDITVVCDGGNVETHKILLAVNSHYFVEYFMKISSEQITQVHLPRIPVTTFRYMCQFMYDGKITLPEDEVQSFIRAGHELKIEGLKTLKETEDTRPVSNQRNIISGYASGLAAKPRPKNLCETTPSQKPSASGLVQMKAMGYVMSDFSSGKAGDAIDDAVLDVEQSTSSKILEHLNANVEFEENGTDESFDSTKHKQSESNVTNLNSGKSTICANQAGFDVEQSTSMHAREKMVSNADFISNEDVEIEDNNSNGVKKSVDPSEQIGCYEKDSGESASSNHTAGLGVEPASSRDVERAKVSEIDEHFSDIEKEPNHNTGNGDDKIVDTTEPEITSNLNVRHEIKNQEEEKFSDEDDRSVVTLSDDVNDSSESDVEHASMSDDSDSDFKESKSNKEVDTSRTAKKSVANIIKNQKIHKRGKRNTRRKRRNDDPDYCGLSTSSRPTKRIRKGSIFWKGNYFTIKEAAKEVIICPKCHKKLRLSNLKLHEKNFCKLNKSTNAVVQKLDCEFYDCDFSSTNPVDLKKHMETHDNDFSCNTCDRKFTTKENYDLHQKECKIPAIQNAIPSEVENEVH